MLNKSNKIKLKSKTSKGIETWVASQEALDLTSLAGHEHDFTALILQCECWQRSEFLLRSSVLIVAH